MSDFEKFKELSSKKKIFKILWPVKILLAKSMKLFSMFGLYLK